MPGLRRLTQEVPQTSASPSTSQVDYKASYQAKVVAASNDSNGALTLDLSPLDTRFGTFKAVPCMFGAPGLTISVRPGSTVFFTFFNGQPGQAYVSSWDPMNSVIELIIAGDSNSPAAARVTDPVDYSEFIVTAPPDGGTCALSGTLKIGPTGSGIVKIGG